MVALRLAEHNAVSQLQEPGAVDQRGARTYLAGGCGLL